MNYKIKIGLSFIGGTALGSLITYFFVSEKYKKITQEEIDSVKEVYKREYSKPFTIISEDVIKTEESKKNNNNPLVFTSKKEPIPYHTMVKKEEEYEEEYEEVEDMIEYDDAYVKGYSLTHERETVNPNPYIITEDEFSSDKLHFSKEYLIYYEKDDILVDEDEDIIEDSRAILGYGTLEKLNSVDNVIYVRNERLGIDYEVERSSGRYMATYPQE